MRRVFFSSHWKDSHRVNQIRNSQVLKNYETKGFINAAVIEEVKAKNDAAVKNWIDDQMHGASVTAVLIGAKTAERRWIRYELEKSVEDRKGLLGIYIHNVKDMNGEQSYKGESPFRVCLGFKPTHNPSYPCASYYDWVSDDGYENIEDWIEKAAGQAGR